MKPTVFVMQILPYGLACSFLFIYISVYLSKLFAIFCKKVS